MTIYSQKILPTMPQPHPPGWIESQQYSMKRLYQTQNSVINGALGSPSVL